MASDGPNYRMLYRKYMSQSFGRCNHLLGRLMFQLSAYGTVPETGQNHLCGYICPTNYGQ